LDGFWFYWTAWLAFIYSAFFTTRHTYVILLYICSIITASYFSVSTPGAELNGAALLLALGGCAIIIKSRKRLVWGLFCSLGVALLFGWLEYVYYFEPVWMLLPFEIVLACTAAILLILLGRDFAFRSAVLFTGFFQGGAAFSYFAAMLDPGRYSGITTGVLSQLDILALAFLAVSFWSALEWSAVSLRTIVLPHQPVPALTRRKVNI
jgi:hypothetical protein